MKRRKDAESSELSRTFCSTCSHRTASAAGPGAFAMARRATRDTDASTLSIATAKGSGTEANLTRGASDLGGPAERLSKLGVKEPSGVTFQPR